MAALHDAAIKEWASKATDEQLSDWLFILSKEMEKRFPTTGTVTFTDCGVYEPFVIKPGKIHTFDGSSHGIVTTNTSTITAK